MAYEKGYQVVMDSPVGKQTINRELGNQDEIRAQLLVEHGGNEYGISFGAWGILKSPQFGPKYDVIGRHNLPEIPRAIGRVLYTSTPSVSVKFQWTGPGMPSLLRVGAGDYYIATVGLSKIWAVARAMGAVGTRYLEPQVRPFTASSANGFNTGIHVKTLALSGGDFVATDMSFVIALYGQP